MFPLLGLFALGCGCNNNRNGCCNHDCDRRDCGCRKDWNDTRNQCEQRHPCGCYDRYQRPAAYDAADNYAAQ
ncbi:MAG: hypothetical protein LBM78_04885 [Clostridiales bacterium]|jgi:hypothetical protein|nr:hypothetical protein [Clostridiales bacterium]